MFIIFVCLPRKQKGHIQFGACLLGIFLISGISCLGVDKTREPNTSGVDVVKATLRQIQDSHIFPNDNGFLRRLAYVESQDGTDPMTYRDGYHGGIWQINESLFDMAKSKTSIELHRQIASKFKIIWVNVAWNDLRKPLHSALAASMYMTLIDTVPAVYAIHGQAQYWTTHFNTDPSRLKTEGDFVAAVEALKIEECKTARLDVAFVVDGSGSVEEQHFNTALDFIGDIVENFDIGPDGVRVGFIQFEAHPTVEIRMNEYTDKASLHAAIQNIQYVDGGTKTGIAINEMVNTLFGNGNGARNPEDNVPRIGIVMTDGKSHDEVIGPADAAREQDITLYAIGIGSGIDDEEDNEELRQIANDPDEKYVVHVNDYSVIDNIRYEISQDTCEEPTVPNVGEKLNSSLNSASKVYFESDIPSSGKMTFTLTASKGKATAYLSTLIRNPNEAFHQWSVEASVENPLAQVYIDTTTTTQDEGSRKKRQVAEDGGQHQLYGTIINTYEVSEPNSDDMATGAHEPETIFSVLVEEGDTRIIVPTTERDITTIHSTTPEKPSILTEEIAASGLSAGAISGVAIAVVVIILIIIVVLAFVLIKRKRAKEPDPNLINQRRGMSTVSTMSAEMAQQEPYSEPYRIGSPSTSSANAPDAHYVNYQMGAQGSSCHDDVVMDYPVKPGQIRPEDEGSDENVYTADPHREPMQRSSIYEVETVPDQPGDSIYAISTIG